MLAFLLSLTAHADPDDWTRTPMEQCSSQRLHNAVQLPESPTLYTINNPHAAYGTPELVQAITHASQEMGWLMPQADPLLIGDLSRPRGGSLPPHKSHRSGLDADIGIYRTGGVQPEGAPFVVVTAQTIDHEANWMFWSALLETGMVDRILLDQRLIDTMRAWTIETETLTEAEALVLFPPAGTPHNRRTGVFQHVPRHRDHIHLRVLCGPPQDQIAQLP